MKTLPVSDITDADRAGSVRIDVAGPTATIYYRHDVIPLRATRSEDVMPVTAYALRKALNREGLRAAVEAAVASSKDPDLIDFWEYATEFERHHPLIVRIGKAIGKTDSEIDALFLLAATL